MKDRKGMNVAISAVIMTGVILAVTVAAAYFAETVLRVQMDNTEFEQAKNNMMTLADMVEDVATSVPYGSAHYVRINLRTSRPCFVRDSHDILVTISGFGTAIQGKSGSFEVAGGSLASAVDRLLFGSDVVLVGDIEKPLGLLREEQDEGAWLRLDFARVRVTNQGCFHFMDVGWGVDGYLNVVRVAFINVTIGKTAGSNPLDVYVRSVGARLETRYLPPNDVTVNVVVDGKSDSVVIHGLQTVTVDGVEYPVLGTILQVLVSDVQISTL